ncbi:hypothetical protein D9M70_567430 [compost metagenome]
MLHVVRVLEDDLQGFTRFDGKPAYIVFHLPDDGFDGHRLVGCHACPFGLLRKVNRYQAGVIDLSRKCELLRVIAHIGSGGLVS